MRRIRTKAWTRCFGFLCMPGQKVSVEMFSISKILAVVPISSLFFFSSSYLSHYQTDRYVDTDTNTITKEHTHSHRHKQTHTDRHTHRHNT